MRHLESPDIAFVSYVSIYFRAGWEVSDFVIEHELCFQSMKNILFRNSSHTYPLPKERGQFLVVSYNYTFSSFFIMLKETEICFVNVYLNGINCFFLGNYCSTETVIHAELEFNRLLSLLLLPILVFLICF